MAEFYIRMKGLPWHSNVENVQKFFDDVVLRPSWIHIIKMPDGRDSGEALVGIAAEEDLRKCLKRDKKYMGKRYIELYEATQDEWNRITNRIHRTNKVPIDEKAFVVLMRGLPYSAQEDDCISFFKSIQCLGVHLPKDRFGRPSGQGYAEFKSEELFNKAMEFDRKHMQNRYIELFKSNVKELVTAMSNTQGHRDDGNMRFREGYNKDNFEKFIKRDPNEGSRRSNGKRYNNNYVGIKQCGFGCVQLLGLDSSINEQHLHDFFKNNHCQAIKMHRKYDGTEVFVEVVDDHAVQRALLHDKSIINGKQVRIHAYDYGKMMSKIQINNHVNQQGRRRKSPEVIIDNYNDKTNYTNQHTPESYNHANAIYPNRMVTGHQIPGNSVLLRTGFPQIVPHAFPYQITGLPITPVGSNTNFVFPAPAATSRPTPTPLIYPATRIPTTPTTPGAASHKSIPSYVYTPRY